MAQVRAGSTALQSASLWQALPQVSGGVADGDGLSDGVTDGDGLGVTGGNVGVADGDGESKGEIDGETQLHVESEEQFEFKHFPPIQANPLAQSFVVTHPPEHVLAGVVTLYTHNPACDAREGPLLTLFLPAIIELMKRTPPTRTAKNKIPRTPSTGLFFFNFEKKVSFFTGGREELGCGGNDGVLPKELLVAATFDVTDEFVFE